MMWPIFRQAVPSDHAALCEIFNEIDKLHAEALPDVFVPYQGPPRTADFIEQSIEGEDSTIIVAEVENNVVGLAAMQVQESPPLKMFAYRRFAVPDNLIVTPAHRRKGMGTLLVLERPTSGLVASGSPVSGSMFGNSMTAPSSSIQV